MAELVLGTFTGPGGAAYQRTWLLRCGPESRVHVEGILWCSPPRLVAELYLRHRATVRGGGAQHLRARVCVLGDAAGGRLAAALATRPSLLLVSCSLDGVLGGVAELRVALARVPPATRPRVGLFGWGGRKDEYEELAK